MDEKEQHWRSLPICYCKQEPLSACGLEGFVRGEKYRYEEIHKDKNGKLYFRVYHSFDYYETCSKNSFSKFFTHMQVPSNFAPAPITPEAGVLIDYLSQFKIFRSTDFTKLDLEELIQLSSIARLTKTKKP